MPPRPANVVATAIAADATAELRIVNRPGGHLSFEIVAWSNLEDAGGNPHHVWHIFHPVAAFITDSFDTAVEAALTDARARLLSVGPVTRVEREQGR